MRVRGMIAFSATNHYKKMFGHNWDALERLLAKSRTNQWTRCPRRSPTRWWPGSPSRLYEDIPGLQKVRRHARRVLIYSGEPRKAIHHWRRLIRALAVHIGARTCSQESRLCGHVSWAGCARTCSATSRTYAGESITTAGEQVRTGDRRGRSINRVIARHGRGSARVLVVDINATAPSTRADPRCGGVAQSLAAACQTNRPYSDGRPCVSWATSTSR
jgi:hypothetical protein